MLSDAKRLGFVEIKIVSPTHKHEALSSQLSELLKIKDVQVIASESNDLTLNTVGRAAASALLKTYVIITLLRFLGGADWKRLL